MKKVIAGALAAVMALSLFTADVPAVNAAAIDGAKAAPERKLRFRRAKGTRLAGLTRTETRFMRGTPAS